MYKSYGTISRQEKTGTLNVNHMLKHDLSVYSQKSANMHQNLLS